MSDYIFVGCDLHDRNMLLKLRADREDRGTCSFSNTACGRMAMIAKLKKLAGREGGAKILFAYEASGQGFGLHFELTREGIPCHVLAPSKIERSPKERHSKTDERDAERLADLLAGHYLAGTKLPEVWIPDRQTLEDREVTRGRLDVGDELTAAKTKVQSLLKRNSLGKPAWIGGTWTRKHRAWLEGLLDGSVPGLPEGARIALASLMRQVAFFESEVDTMNEHVAALAETPRYAKPVEKMTKRKGVGPWTAMAYLTEMADLSRFGNRGRVGSFLGMVPKSDNSGDTVHLGHITHQGPARVRKVLSQATWVWVRFDPEAKRQYERLVAANPKHKKIALVAMMRRLAIHLWRDGREAQVEAGIFARPDPASV